MGARASQASNRRNPRHPTNLNSLLSKSRASKISNLLIVLCFGPAQSPTHRAQRELSWSSRFVTSSLLFTTGQIEGSVLDRSSAFLSYPYHNRIHACLSPSHQLESKYRIRRSRLRIERCRMQGGNVLPAPAQHNYSTNSTINTLYKSPKTPFRTAPIPCYTNAPRFIFTIRLIDLREEGMEEQAFVHHFQRG